MKIDQRCPNGCGDTMTRVPKSITLNYSDPRHKYSRNLKDQVHEAYYACTNCKRTYVSSVFKRFKIKHVMP